MIIFNITNLTLPKETIKSNMLTFTLAAIHKFRCYKRTGYVVIR